MPDDHQPELNPPGPRKRSASRRRGRRGGRGRSLRRPQAVSTSSVAPLASAGGAMPAAEEQRHEETGMESPPAERPPVEPKMPYRPELERSRHESHFPQQAPPSLAQAADEVRQVVESLEEALEQMEHVLELVETAEEQKIGDEREIENLRRALRRIQAPRHEPPRERRSDHRRDERQRHDESREGQRHEELRREEPSQEPEQLHQHEAPEEPPPGEFGSEEQAS
ncbi:MAG TPA: hypothetical protein VGV18_02445 [Verrucomicrobiae bacterium]|nr:hypothetical protein [Verrucomicrobiae bacterium]